MISILIYVCKLSTPVAKIEGQQKLCEQAGFLSELQNILGLYTESLSKTILPVKDEKIDY